MLPLVEGIPTDHSKCPDAEKRRTDRDPGLERQDRVPVIRVSGTARDQRLHGCEPR